MLSAPKNGKYWTERLGAKVKYHNGRSMKCGHCGDMILAWSVTENPKHIYHVGMFFDCIGCHKSRIWTNSVRNPVNFVKFLTGEVKEYYNGFCNDQFCGYCFSYIQPLKNGYEWNGKRWDRYGCEKCQQNQMILVDGHLKDGEGETNWITQWYRRHESELFKLVSDR